MSAGKRRRMGGGGRVRARRQAGGSRGVAKRRTATRTTRRAASPKRMQVRTARRKAVRKAASIAVPRPRPVERPAWPAQRTVRKASPTRRISKTRKVGRVARPSARQMKRAAGVGAVAAAAATGAFLRLNTAYAHPEIITGVNTLQYSLDELQERASFGELEADLTSLDANLKHALSLLESAREKGYKYQKDLEEMAYEAMSRWQEIRGDVEANVRQQIGWMQNSLAPIDAQVQRLNAALDSTLAASMLNELDSEVDAVLARIGETEDTIESAYADIEEKAQHLNARLTTIHWALTQAEEASFAFEREEDLVMAVAARWDYEGKNDPEGVLYLTNQRLIFERKEKVATKKVLFITTAKELVQQLMIGQALGNIQGVKAQNKGLFGHQDFIEVTFKDAKIGVVPFHLNGQDAEAWVRWIEGALSGKIEEDRTSGSGLSFAALTGALTTADIVDVQNEVNELQDEMMLKESHAELTALENQVSSLARELADLRGRGYAVEKSLEADVKVLGAQWERIKRRAEATMAHQVNLLGEQMTAIQEMTAELAGMAGNLAVARPLYVRLKSAIASAEAQAEAAEETVLDQYEAYADEIEALDSHFEWIDWMLDALETASFKLLATESGVAATAASWERPGLAAENGVLFLTDQRLLWEDRVDDFEVKIDVASSQLEGVTEDVDEESGREYLVVELGSGGPLQTARFALAQPVAEEWLQMIGRARSGGYAEDRAIALDEAALARIRNAPEQCPQCGAAFTAPVLRGQLEIVCEFCGTATRI